MTTSSSRSVATATGRAHGAAGTMMNKVPEITIWFWVIKILCTTVGESFADYINETLGFGLTNTTILFTVIFAVVLGVQLRLKRYVPAVYWLTVVVVSVAGTLYTDNLTDAKGVPLALSTAVFSGLLVVVFGIWFVREGTLSIHSIVTFPREAFYWLAVLVTFALGTATGDWSLQLTGWSPGVSVLLPAALIAVVALAWRFGGAQPVLSFWLAYILTRPLGANIGDYLASPKDEGGLNLGTLITSLIFLGAIAATVVYLSISRADVIDQAHTTDATEPATANKTREHAMLGVFVVAALATAGLLYHANQQPHADGLAAEEGPGPAVAPLSPQQATAPFPAQDIKSLATITQGTLTTLQSGDQAGATSSVDALETTWDKDQPALQPMDGHAWHFIDNEIDDVLTALRAPNPDVATETQALDALLTTLKG